MLAACGGSDGASGGGGGSTAGVGGGGTATVTGPGTSTGQAEGGGGGAPVTTKTIGASGGTVETPEGVVLVIPAGALAEDTTIAITQVTEGVPNGIYSGLYDLQPDGLTFSQPVSLTIPIDAQAASGVPSSEMAIATYDGGSFRGAGWTLVDRAPGRASALIQHFSKWAIVPSPPEAARSITVVCSSARAWTSPRSAATRPVRRAGGCSPPRSSTTSAATRTASGRRRWRTSATATA